MSPDSSTTSRPRSLEPYQVIDNVSGLQAVQNSAARIVTQERMRDHDSMSCALMELQVDKRIEYKLLLYTYKALHGLAPCYLCELVVPYAPRRVLRSAEFNLLTFHQGNLVNLHIYGTLYGERGLPGLRILRIHRRHTKVHKYPQYNSVRHLSNPTIIQRHGYNGISL